MTPVLPQNYPLQWPDGWKRTQYHSWSAYRVTAAKAFADAHAAARKFAAHYSITSDLMLRIDGKQPLSSQREPVDPGVAFWWTERKATLGATRLHVLACDQFTTVRENYRALGLAIEALLQLKRSGASQIFNRSVESFERPVLPPPQRATPKRPGWFEVLKLPEDFWPPLAAQINQAFKNLAYVHHPDRGGDTKRMQEINKAHAEALVWLASRA